NQVLDVRDRALVELLRPALLDQQAWVARVVRHHDQVTARTLAARQRRLDLREEGRVVVDVLGVVDVDAELLLELVERRVAVPLLVDVERPVREVQRFRQLVARSGARACLGRAAAGREQAWERQHGAACGGALKQFATGQLISHAASSIGSTTNVASGSQPRVRWSPGLCGTVPGRSLRTTT